MRLLLGVPFFTWSRTQTHIKCFNNRVKYMASKARPKRVSLKTLETAETVYFLCKQASECLACRGNAIQRRGVT